MGVMPMDPMAGMGAPPGGMPPGGMPSALPPLEPPDPVTMVIYEIEAMVEAQGADAVRDMLSALPPETLESLYELIETDVRAAIAFGDLLDPPEREPQYDAWYEEPPKPTPTEIKETAYADSGIWQDVSTKIKENLEWYYGEHPNVFRNFDRKKEEYFWDSMLREDSDTKIALIGNTPITFEVPFTTYEIEDATQKAENFLYYVLRCWEHHFARVNAGRALKHDVAWYQEVAGWVFYECAVDTNGGKPFQHRLHDPTTCVPSWDEYGLARVTRVYQDTVAKVISTFDTDGSVRRKLLVEETPRKDGKVRALQYTEWVQVTYYVDRAWRALYVDDVEIIAPVKHGYGVVPFVVGGSGLGEPLHFEASAGTSDLPDPIAGGGMGRLKYKNPCGFEHRKRTHAQKEAVVTKLFNMASRIDRPDWLIEQDEYAEGEGTPAVKRGGNEVTTIKKGHEALTPLLETVGGDFFDPLIGAIANMDLRSALPLAQYGMSDSSQQTGNAIEGHIESGKEKFSVQLQAMEVFWGEVASLWLRLYRDFGHLVPNERGEYGRQIVPYLSRDRWKQQSKERSFELTPEMLDHIGTEVEASMIALRLQNLGPLGNSTAVWMQNHTMSAREAMELRGVKDPDMVIAEMDWEEIVFDPEIKKLRKLKLLRQRDPELARLYEQSIMRQSAPPPGMGVGGGMGDGPITPNTSSMNLPALGVGNTQGAGRPMGADGVDVPPGVVPPPGPGGMQF